MYYFYVLQFKQNRKLYYGYTNDLKRRIEEHKIKKTGFVSKNSEFQLIYYEAYLNKNDAQKSEKYFKTGHGREVLKEKLKYYLGRVA